MTYTITLTLSEGDSITETGEVPLNPFPTAAKSLIRDIIGRHSDVTIISIALTLTL